MSPADNAGREGGIGARLQAARTRRGLTPGQAAERLHLDPMVIDALEHERFGALGASVYVRGHLRRYAELLGEPADELQQLYARSTHAAALPDLTRIAQAERPPADRRRLYVPGVAVLLGFGIMGAVWWVVSDLRLPAAPPAADAKQGAPADAAPTSSTPAAASTAPAVSPATSVTDPQAVPGDAAAPVVAAGDGGDVMPTSDPAAAAVPPATAVPVSTATLPAGGSEALSPDARFGAAPASSADAAQKAGDVRLTLRVTADSWVEVYDAGGRRLFYDVIAASGMQRLSGAGPLRVVLGNPPGVAMEVNGRPTPLPEGLRRAETVQFVVEPTGRLVRARTGAVGG